MVVDITEEEGERGDVLHLLVGIMNIQAATVDGILINNRAVDILLLLRVMDITTIHPPLLPRLEATIIIIIPTVTSHRHVVVRLPLQVIILIITIIILMDTILRIDTPQAIIIIIIIIVHPHVIHDQVHQFLTTVVMNICPVVLR